MAIFNGTYTIENTKTTEHRTFSLKTQAPDAKFAPGSRILALLNGPDNEANYQGFAFLGTDDRFSVWKSKRGSSPKGGGAYQYSAFEVFAAMLADLLSKGNKSVWFARGYRLHAANTCIRCNRKLTTPESVKCGIGPDCAEKMGVDRSALAAAFDRARQEAEKSIPVAKVKLVMPKPSTAPICDDTAYFVQQRREEAARLKQPANLWSDVGATQEQIDEAARAQPCGKPAPAQVGGVSLPIVDEDEMDAAQDRDLLYGDDSRFDAEIQRRDQEDNERAARAENRRSR